MPPGVRNYNEALQHVDHDVWSLEMEQIKVYLEGYGEGLLARMITALNEIAVAIDLKKLPDQIQIITAGLSGGDDLSLISFGVESLEYPAANSTRSKNP